MSVFRRPRGLLGFQARLLNIQLPVAAGHAPQSKAGVVVSWTTHDLLSLDCYRWPEYHGTQEVMNGALGHVLGVLGFQVAQFGSGGAHIVTAGPTTASR